MDYYTTRARKWSLDSPVHSSLKSAFTSTRLPALFAIALAGLLVANWSESGAVAPVLPQILANHAYRELWSGHYEGPQGAIELFRQALAADAAFTYRWSDLGEALAAAGQSDSARYCFLRSLKLAPDSPQIALRAANFELREQDIDSALQLGGTVLRLAPDYDDMVFSSWIRFAGEQDRILRTGIGSNPRAAEAFFHFLIRANDEARLAETWRWMDAHSYVTAPAARTWASWLLGRHRDQEAFLIWKRHIALNSSYGVSNWIDDSGFESPPAGEGFGWRIEPVAGVKAAIDPAVAHSGHASLRVEFDGSQNLDFHPVAQRVWLQPGRYRLTAWIRTSGLTTDQGLALSLLGISTPALTGSHDWTNVGADVVVGQAAAADVQVVRRRSWRFDAKPTGKIWIDDVELRRIDK